MESRYQVCCRWRCGHAIDGTLNEVEADWDRLEVMPATRFCIQHA